MNGYKELETCGVMLMGLTSSRMVFNHSKFGKKKAEKKETNVMVSNMHVTHITFTLWIRIRLSCLWFQTSRKKKCISLVTCFFYPHFVVEKKFWVWGIWGWFHCMRNSTPTNKLIFMLALRIFFLIFKFW